MLAKDWLATGSMLGRETPVGYAIALLGTFQVRYDAVTISRFRGAKVEALLAYLSLESDRPHRRSTLAGLLWPELPTESALRNLTQAVVRLRAALTYGEAPLSVTPTELQWRVDEAQVDAVEFLQLAKSTDGADLDRAVALYHGELLAGFDLPGCEEFEEWLFLRREQLREEALRVLQRLSERHLAEGQASEAAVAASRQLALDPWREVAFRQLMLAHAMSGDRASALATYARCVDVLRDALGVAPDDETVQLAERIRVGDPALSAGWRPRAQHSVRAPSLPAPLLPLIGREDELKRLTELMVGSTRLVSLVGMGGVGKTRLALEAAWALRPKFRDDVWWVNLTGVQADDDPDLQRAALAGGIAAALGLILDGQRSALDGLATSLHDRTALLVLDNCEHLPEAGTVIHRLLEVAPTLSLLATSREPLALRGEVPVRLAGLPVPASGEANPGEQVAVRLFLDHARRRVPGWGEDPRELAGAARLCRLVDGLPLGIELAASWVDHYAPDEIGNALQADLDSLPVRTRDTPDRQRSLWSIFDSTWNLLTERQRRALARLSIFRGSFEREAALTVAAVTAATLVELVDKSLLRQAGPGRYSLHELVRQFAAERLARDLESMALPKRYAEYYLALAEQAAPTLTGFERAIWIPRLEAELDNLRAALAFARAEPEPDLEMRLAGALGHFWLLRGYVGEGWEWVEHALDRPEAGDAPLRMRARLCEASGMMLIAQGERERGGEWFEQSAALYRADGDMRGELNVRILMGGAAYDNAELPRAATIWEACVQTARELDELGTLGRALNNLGAAWYYMGDLDRASAYLEESLAIDRRIGRRDSVSVQLTNLGNVARRMGDTARAHDLLREALQLKVELNDPRQIAVTLEAMAAVAVTTGDMPRAARLLGAARRVRTRLGAVSSEPEKAEVQQTADRGRCALGEVAWSAQFEAGRALALEDVVADALHADGR